MKRIRKEIHAICTVAYRDLIKLLRDRMRLFAGFVFPLLFIGVLGGSLSASIGGNLGFDYLTFVFIGVFAQSLFQSSAAGVISLIQDRENDFSQELFIAPVSRYSIIFGKILGETLVSYTSGAGILLLGFLFGVSFTPMQFLLVIASGIASCLFGGAFGVLVLANVSSQRTVAQVFPFVLFPQIFLSGVFNPVDTLPPILLFFSRITPLTYAVDLVRNAYYAGHMPSDRVVALSPFTDLMVIGMLFIICLVFGTILFIRKERNR